MFSTQKRGYIRCVVLWEPKLCTNFVSIQTRKFRYFGLDQIGELRVNSLA